MLDIKFIRSFPDKVRENIKIRNAGGAKEADLDTLLDLDKARLDVLKKVEDHRALRNALTDKISKIQDAEEKKKLLDEAGALKTELKTKEDDLKILEGKIEELLLIIPNILADDVPVGKGDGDHIELAAWIPGVGYLPKEKLGSGTHSAQYMPKFEFKPKDHVELGKKLDIIDVEQSALVSGSRFYYLKKGAALLQDAVVALLKKKLQDEGFIPMVVPLLVKERVLYGTSHFPEGRDQVYEIKNEFVEEKNNLFLVGSSEPSLFAYYMDKTLDKKALPQKVYAYTPCFRTEVGSWGKDVKGIKRVHQFDKLEMDIVCAPEESDSILEYLRGLNEWFYQALKLPYRVIYKCSGDCGYAATHKQYDNEVWLPSQQEFVEMGSNTNATDYQARRMNIRFKDGGDTRYVHTVNDTGCPSRIIIAILDNYQREDGTISIPEVLQPLMGMKELA